MATIVTRSGKGSALTFDEMDANFTNLNNELANVTLGVLPANSVSSTELQDTGDFTMNTVTTTAGIEVGGSILPTANNAVDLGSPTKMFRDLYLGPDSLYVNGVKILQSNAASMQFTTDASSNQEIFFQPDGDFRMASTQGDVIVNTGSTLKVDTIEGVGQTNIPSTIQADGFQSGTTSLTANKISRSSGNMEIETATGGGEYIHLETNDVYMGTFASAVRVSDGTVTTAAGDLNLKSVDGNVVIAVDANDKDVILKIKDAGGTLQTAATLRDYSYTENATDGDSGTAATNYKPVLDVDQGIRIGNDSANFSSTDEAGNNNTDDFNQLGILVDNGDEDKWPQISLVSYGGANPLRNRSGDAAIGGTQTVTGLSGTGGTGSSATFDVYRNGLAYEKPSSGNTDGINNAGSGYTAGDTIVITGDNFSNAFFGTPGQTPENDLTVTVDTVDGSGAITAVSFSGTAQGGLATHYSTSAISLKAASGTSSSPQRLFQGARIGQISFTGYDGNKFGGTNAIASASLTVEATEHFSTTNARGASAYFDILKTGGAATDGDSTSDRIKGWKLQGNEFTINPDSKDLDFAVNGDTVDDIIKVDAANESFSSASAKIDFTNLPTSDPAVAGRLWNDSGTLKVSAG